MSPLRAPLTALVPVALLRAAWGLSAASVSCSGRSKVKLKFTCRTQGPAAQGWGASWQGACLQDGAVWTWVSGPGSWVSPTPIRWGCYHSREDGSCTLRLCTLGAPSVQGTWPSWHAFLPDTEGNWLWNEGDERWSCQGWCLRWGVCVPALMTAGQRGGRAWPGGGVPALIPLLRGQLSRQLGLETTWGACMGSGRHVDVAEAPGHQPALRVSLAACPQ